MKRYVHPLKGFKEPTDYVPLFCRPAIEYFSVEEVQAWALKHKATVEGMEHVDGCAANKCMVCGCSVVTDTNHYFGSLPSHNPASGQCNCPRGDALREIEELLK